jgi:hypothetical protein
MKRLLSYSVLGLLAAAMVALPAQVLAQSTNSPAPKQRHPPIHGKLAAVDLTAKTLKVAETTYEVTATTRIMKSGKPATLEDGVVGEEVTISWQDQEGKKVATRVYFGARPEKKAPASTPPSTPPATPPADSSK